MFDLVQDLEITITLYCKISILIRVSLVGVEVSSSSKSSLSFKTDLGLKISRVRATFFQIWEALLREKLLGNYHVVPCVSQAF